MAAMTKHLPLVVDTTVDTLDRGDGGVLRRTAPYPMYRSLPRRMRRLLRVCFGPFKSWRASMRARQWRRHPTLLPKVGPHVYCIS